MATNTRPIQSRDYLPEVFRADEEKGVSFLSRFLNAFEVLFEALEDEIEGTPGGALKLTVQSISGTKVTVAPFNTGAVGFPSGTSVTLQSALAANWLLDEGQGQLGGDVSNHGLTGQLGAPPNDPQWISGKLGTAALRFDGDDFVEVARSALLEPRTITAEAWVRSSDPGFLAYILSKGAKECVAASYGLYTGSSGGLFFYVFDGASFVLSPDGGTAVWDGNWHHVAGTFDGHTVRLYVDGTEVGSDTPTTLAIRYGLPAHNRFYIGAYRGTCDLMFVGDISEVKVWTRALTPSEVAQRVKGRELVVSNEAGRTTLAQAISAGKTGLTQIEVQDAFFATTLHIDDILQVHPGGIPDLFNSDTTPPPQFPRPLPQPDFDYLNYLAGWIALPLRVEKSESSEHFNRAFFKAAIPLYPQRGTLPGMEALLRAWLKGDLLETNPPLLILTDLARVYNDVDAIFQLAPEGTEDRRPNVIYAQLGVNTVLGEGPPFFFIADLITNPTVREVRNPVGLDVFQRAARFLLDAEKPAHTYYQLRLRAYTMQLAPEGNEDRQPDEVYAQLEDPHPSDPLTGTTLLWDAPWVFDSDC